MSIFDIFNKIEKKEKETQEGRGAVSWLIVGLGNPGKKYDGTRHNAGFFAIDLYLSQSGQRMGKLKFKAETLETMLGGARVLLMKPQTFMNLSGEAVRDAAVFYKIPPEHVIVLVDDVSLDVGTLRVRAKGSAGGQNGLKNIIYHLQTDEFPRVKIGVGKKPHPDYDLVDWVLSRFSADEQKPLTIACKDAMLAAEMIIRQDCAAAAQSYNGTRIK